MTARFLKMLFLVSNFLPLLIFVALYVGTGLYLTAVGVEQAFYQLPPTIAILPAIILAWLLYRGNTKERLQGLLDGMRHPDILSMCLIFLLAGAFSSITSAIGSIDALVQLAFSFIPGPWLLMGLFITAALLSIALGTSMGTIAAITPVAYGLSAQGAFPAALGAATVVGGAMLGDNLSLISDTTIASVLSQQADWRAKCRLNAQVACVTTIITLALLWCQPQHPQPTLDHQPYSLVLILPYCIVITLALLGTHVFIALTLGIMSTMAIGFIATDYPVLALAQSIANGFTSMQEILLLSLLIGGLSGLMAPATRRLTQQLTAWLTKWEVGYKPAQFLIAAIVSLFNLLLANNTIAIIVSGDFAKSIGERYQLPAHYRAVCLDCFACVIQGVIPYGAQILLASSIAKVSPIAVTQQVYYCYALAVVTSLWIVSQRNRAPVGSGL